MLKKMPTSFLLTIKCNNCNFEVESFIDLDKHIVSTHKRPNHKTEDVLLLGDSLTQYLKPRLIEKHLKGKLFSPCWSRPKEGRAYCSSSNWPNARFPNSSIDRKLPELLAVRPYKGVVMPLPANDLTNIKDLSRKDQFLKAEKSSLNVLAVAEKALRDFPTLKTVLLLEHPPRDDSLAEVNEYSNSVLRAAAENSTLNDRIKVRALDSLNMASRRDVFGPANGSSWFDGIHLRGKQGSTLFTKDIIADLKDANMTKDLSCWG